MNDTSLGEQQPVSPSTYKPEISKLIGSFDRNIDTKSRVGLPVQFREKLEDSPLILVTWMNRSLAVFPECNWLPLAESIAQLDLYTPMGMTVRHQMFANAREVGLDKEGRIIVPPDMVEYARLDGKVMVVGDWDKITIWNAIYYKDQMAVSETMMNQVFPSVMQIAKGQKRLEDLETNSPNGDG